MIQQALCIWLKQQVRHQWEEELITQSEFFTFSFMYTFHGLHLFHSSVSTCINK